MKAKDVESALKNIGTPKRAQTSLWFFKTGKGQYGYGDQFIGVSVPDQRKIAKEYRDLDITEIKKLLDSKLHECRLTALMILALHFKKADRKTQKVIFDFYLSNTNRINSWDLVDSSCDIVGLYLLDKNRSVLYELAKSENMWERRIAIVATFRFIKTNQFDDTIKLCKMLIDDEQDLMHKAVGWMLREVGKRDIQILDNFLDENTHKLARTTLRYALERYPENIRKKYLSIKKNLIPVEN